MTLDTDTRAAAPAPPGPPRRFEVAPIAGVLAREWALYRRSWRPTTFAAVAEPVIMLLAFGVGLGSLIGAIGGYDYIEFLGTGIVATSVLFTSMFPGLIDTFVRRVFQHTYDGMLAAPVDVRELVTGEATWIACKAGVYGCAPLLVAIGFGLPASPAMLLVPVIAFVTGFGFALTGVWLSAVVPSIKTMDYIISGVITPLYLIAGTFFPIDSLPAWAQVVARINPLYHCVELVRATAFGMDPLRDLGHFAALLAFVALVWFLAVWQMRRRLID
ncbi:ABC transporter permease [Streptomonospora nanhaiensis]|uniref:Transport permease protein n=1 Tax=Streptomonospora nanhaiensis TaxID=1323731 RepID=A0A853BQ23_9ACTN|nr:ABC transporter permease [Streptomonospora nanhaiensis]MBV2362859.1 ABC transporter permease [Streptomonospora nanhaiensis]MBX9387030.1 ABC transporter permease [Streptomonospora nanhaiensis]NYI97779.1 lipooligosaccharide transport system permease protein [Streptomonospora nanhaiensis]